MHKEINWIIWITIIVNVTILVGAFIAGEYQGDPAQYFKERQIVTLFSTIQLAMSALLAFLLFIVQKDFRSKKEIVFWFLCGLGFLWLMCDEWFMIHEGIDDGILGALGFQPAGRHFLFDWMVIGAYGVAALVLCIKYYREIIRTRRRLWLFALAALFYVLQTGFDAFEGGAIMMVTEESLKLVSVCFFYLFFNVAFLESIAEIRAGRHPASADEEQRTLTQT